jgi:hypothetical protein
MKADKANVAKTYPVENLPSQLDSFDALGSRE